MCQLTSNHTRTDDLLVRTDTGCNNTQNTCYTELNFTQHWYNLHFKAINIAFCGAVFAIYSGIAIAWHDTGAYKVKGIASCDILRKERITLLFAWLVQAFTLIADVILIY